MTTLDQNNLGWIMETNDSASDVPEGWVECHLGSIIHVQNGYAFPSKDYRDEGVPLIRN